MRTITLRLSDDVHQGITVLAVERNVSISKLYEDISGIILRGYAAEARFFARVADGSKKKGLEILEILDKHYMDNQ